MLRGETCDGCGFDARAWSIADLVHTLDVVGPWWREATRAVDPALRDRRPAPSTWSATEYAAHSRDVTEGLGLLLHAILTTDGLDISIPPPGDGPHDTAGGFDAVVDQLDDAAGRVVRLAAATTSDGWRRTAIVDGEPLDAADVLAHAVHDATHHLRDLGRGLHALGAPPGHRSGVGHVVQLSVSAGGVPKTAVPSAEVTARGMAGDRQRARRHHGRPWQALCLWSAEVIDGLVAEGHLLAPGAAGENITIGGVDWAAIRPGVRLQIGPALVEASLWALPCKQIAASFRGREFARIHHEREAGISRIYAWVLRGGEVRPGDVVIVEP